MSSSDASSAPSSPAGSSAPVTVAVARAVAPGRHREADAWARAGQELARVFPGYLGSGWVRARGDSDVWHMLYRFDSAEELQVWEDSAERRHWLRMAEPFVTTTRSERRTGIEGWFDAPLESDVVPGPAENAAPPRWKQMVSIFLPFLPLSLAMNYLMAAVAGDWPLWLRSTVSVMVLTPLMTYLFLPWTTRLLRRWLQRR